MHDKRLQTIARQKTASQAPYPSLQGLFFAIYHGPKLLKHLQKGQKPQI